MLPSVKGWLAKHQQQLLSANMWDIAEEFLDAQK